ncbi:MAG: tyrosine-protein phosphatase, partial [Bacteroidales bacterium]|nr:tyrosine-protein phosphatase [Bacteroidales bacterium]
GCSLHQVFFTGASKKTEAKQKGTGVRNARDLGGWPTLDGKKVKYRKFYRGGRMNDPWETMLNKQGKAEVLFEGIGAEIDLRGSDDVVKEPAVKGLEHCAPVIEEGGKCMLGVTNPSNYNCAKWLAFDVQREDMKNKTKDELKKYEPTADEFEAFKVAYRAKTKQLFDFCLSCLKNNKPVYFHCSLGRDRTGTLDIILLGVLGVQEAIIAKEYEVTYFAPVGYSVSSSDKENNPEPIFKNTRSAWVYSDIVPYFWSLAGDGTFAQGVEKYLTEIAGVSKADIEEFRKRALE